MNFTFSMLLSVNYHIHAILTALLATHLIILFKFHLNLYIRPTLNLIKNLFPISTQFYLISYLQYCDFIKIPSFQLTGIYVYLCKFFYFAFIFLATSVILFVWNSQYFYGHTSAIFLSENKITSQQKETGL